MDIYNEIIGHLNQSCNPLIADNSNWGGALIHVFCCIHMSPLPSVLTIVHLKLCDYKITGFQTTEKIRDNFSSLPKSDSALSFHLSSECNY